MKRENGIAPPCSAIWARISVCSCPLWASASASGKGKACASRWRSRALGSREGESVDMRHVRGTLALRIRHAPETRYARPSVVLVTGAARRIGAAIARGLHGAGYDVVLHHRRSHDDVQALAGELEKLRGHAVPAGRPGRV